MKKMSTLFRKDPNDLGRVVNSINPENEWALTEGIATRKYDGAACAIIDGLLYKRYDAKKGKQAPYGAIPCQDADPITGHHPHWILCDSSKPEDRYFFEGFNQLPMIKDGTYELCGPKVQGNPEKFETHTLVRHGHEGIILADLSFDGIRAYLEVDDVEGIVFHHPDGRMCKIRKSDFGIKR